MFTRIPPSVPPPVPPSLRAAEVTAGEVTFLTINPFVDGVNETQIMAMVDGQCVGRVGVKAKDLLCASIRQLYVEPEFRKRGIGKMLVELCFEIAVSAGCESVHLTVAKFNQVVVPFYRRLGFFTAFGFEDGESVMTRPIWPVVEGKVEGVAMAAVGSPKIDGQS